MATTKAGPEGPVSPGNDGVRTKVTSAQTEVDDLTEPKVTAPSPPLYYSVMDDEVFPLPPACASPPHPPEGSAVGGEPAVKVAGGARGVTGENPTALGRPHAEPQSTAAQGHTSLTVSSSAATMAAESTEARPRSHQDTTEEPGREGALAVEQYGDTHSHPQSDMNVVGAVGTRTVSGTTQWFYEETLRENPAPLGLSSEEREGFTPEVDPAAGAEATGGMAAWGASSSGPLELCPHGQPSSEETTPPRGAAGAAESDEDSDEGSVDSQPLEYSQAKQQCWRRDSTTTEVPQPLFPLRRCSSVGHEPRPRSAADLQWEEEEKRGAAKNVVGTSLQQGEQLLQRLFLVQQRQDSGQVAAGATPSDEVAAATANRAEGGCKAEKGEGTDGESGEGRRGHTERVESRKEEQERSVKGAGEGAETRLTGPVQARPQQALHKMEAGGSDDDDQSDSGVSTDCTQETFSSQTPTPDSTSIRPVPSAADREAWRAPWRERAEVAEWRTLGLGAAAENPDVMEIPFKHTVLSKPAPSASQFSQEKMQKEISQEAQRELVLVNMGKIPGGYSKGTVRQMKERKQLFEAFQQGNADGPTGLPRTPASSSTCPSSSSCTGLAVRSHVYPSVLERTRSMEVLSLKSFRISRSQSLRLHALKGSEDASPSRGPGKARREGGGRPGLVTARDGNRLAPYMKQEKHRRLYKSMDALDVHNRDPSRADGERRLGPRRQEGGDEGEALSSALHGNPFFKLRPALALKPEVAKDIREAREREEELRRQRSAVCGRSGPAKGVEVAECYPPPAGRSLGSTPTTTDIRRESKGKLDRMWPPPSSTKDKTNPGQTQQEPIGTGAAGQKNPLWQRWEEGLLNGQQPKKKN